MKEVPQEYRHSIDGLITEGLLNYILELDINSQKFILKIYRDVTETKEKAEEKELNGYRVAEEAKIPVPKIHHISFNPPYILIKKAKGTQLRRILLDKSIEGLTKNRLITEFAETVARLNSLQGKSVDSKSYVQQLLLPTIDMNQEINATAIEPYLKKLIGRVCSSLEERVSGFSGDINLVFIHGDLNPFNIFINRDFTGIELIIDWEKSHYGHPLEDIGFILRTSYLGFSEGFRKAYEEKMGPLDKRQLKFFNDFFNLEFVFNYLLYKDKYNFMPEEKQRKYKIIFDNHITSLEKS